MEGISTDEISVSTMQNFPCPKNHKQLKGFLGLTNVYEKFTDKYPAATQPLLKLLKKTEDSSRPRSMTTILKGLNNYLSTQ